MLRILYDGDLVQMVALSAPVMHPIVRIHMHSALQALGITDHPHKANTVPLRYHEKHDIGGDESLSVSFQWNRPAE